MLTIAWEKFCNLVCLKTSSCPFSLHVWKTLGSCLQRCCWEANASLLPSVSHVTCSVPGDFQLLFICGVLKFHNDTALWDGSFFFLFHQLSLTFGNSYSSVPWNFLNYFFENDFSHIFFLFLDLYCIIWTSHLLCISLPPIFALLCLLCFVFVCF